MAMIFGKDANFIAHTEQPLNTGAPLSLSPCK